MATHSSVLACRIPGTREPGGCRLWGRTELETTEATQQQQQQHACKVGLLSFQRNTLAERGLCNQPKVTQLVSGRKELNCEGCLFVCFYSKALELLVSKGDRILSSEVLQGLLTQLAFILESSVSTLELSHLHLQLFSLYYLQSFPSKADSSTYTLESTPSNFSVNLRYPFSSLHLFRIMALKPELI